MAKLYPPMIEGTIPAFTGTTIVVPFSMNRTVGASEIIGFSLKIKRITDNKIILTKETKTYSFISMSASFELTEEDLKNFLIGNFYKVQIAYVSRATEEAGYYSTTGVIKYTTMPQVYIDGLEKTSINSHAYNYNGVYKQTRTYLDEATNKIEETTLDMDTSEKVYSSRFVLYNADNEILEDSGEIVHNSTKDIYSYESNDTFPIAYDLNLQTSYYIQYTVTTINGLVVSSPRYRLVQRRLIKPELKVNFIAEQDYINGAIVLKMTTDTFTIASGNYVISRCSNKNNYQWEKIGYFSLQSERPDRALLVDYTVEQGYKYKYSIQQYNENNIYSDRIISNEVYADFEDMFLSDGERQLRIRFNPQVSSIKPVTREKLTEATGSRYPFITKNGNINYKEFPISGLISYWMDNDELFLENEKMFLEADTNERNNELVIGRVEDTNSLNGMFSQTKSYLKESNFRTTQLNSYNIAAERIFKNEVLNWLNNGNPKVFRSPTEGNYIVRLMNISLAPNQTLGRMLHSFSCTAYEIDEFSYNNLDKHNFISLKEQLKTVIQWRTIELRTVYRPTWPSEYSPENNCYYASGKINHDLVYSLKFTEMTPGAEVIIDGESIYIGATGSLEIDSKSPIEKIVLPDKAKYSGFLTYSYKTYVSSLFGAIDNMDIEDVPARQIIGSSGGSNILDYIEDIKTTILALYKVRIYKRGVHKIYTNGDGTYYRDALGREVIDIATYTDAWNIYPIYTIVQKPNPDDRNFGYYIDKPEMDYVKYVGMYYDPYRRTTISGSLDNLFEYAINGEKGILEDKEDEEIDLLDMESIYISDGLICELAYQAQVISYSFESSLSNYSYYTNALKAYKTNKSDTNYNNLKRAYEALNEEIRRYIDESLKEV